MRVPDLSPRHDGGFYVHKFDCGLLFGDSVRQIQSLAHLQLGSEIVEPDNLCVRPLAVKHYTKLDFRRDVFRQLLARALVEGAITHTLREEHGLSRALFIWVDREDLTQILGQQCWLVKQECMPAWKKQEVWKES